MTVTEHEDFAVFWMAAHRRFLREPFSNNVPLLLVDRFRHDPPALMLTAHRAELVTSALIATGQRAGLVNAVDADDIEALVDMLAGRSAPAAATPSGAAFRGAVGPAEGTAATKRATAPKVPGVTGQAPLAEQFALTWTERTGRSASVVLRQRLHLLGDLRPARGVRGRARLATEADTETITAFVAAFDAEALGDRGTGTVPAEFAATAISSGQLWLWERLDGTPVAQAFWRGPAYGLSRIGFVYTAPEHRGHGYAAAVTSAACLHALAGGAADVLLFTLAENMTAQGVYQRIGFDVVHDELEFAFE